MRCFTWQCRCYLSLWQAACVTGHTLLANACSASDLVQVAANCIDSSEVYLMLVSCKFPSIALVMSRHVCRHGVALEGTSQRVGMTTRSISER